MVATDGHRLALAETDHKLAGLNGEVKVLIPKKAMDEVEKLSSAAGSDAQIEFAKDESHLFFPSRPSAANFADPHRPIPELRSGAAAGQQQTVVIERAGIR